MICLYKIKRSIYISMENKVINDKYLNKLTKDFDNLVSKDKMSINSLEDIMVNNINEYEKELRLQVEELLKSHINEKKLISKKNKNGKKKDSI